MDLSFSGNDAAETSMRPALALAATLVVAGFAVPAAAAHGDRHFLENALKGDNSEMMLGSLAAERGASPELRDFGRTLRDDHARARDQTVPLARREGVPITQAPMPEAASERRKLERLHGRAFDREFARYMVKDHRKDIAEFEAQARRRGPAGDLAQAILPDLRKHLDMARRLAG